MKRLLRVPILISPRFKDKENLHSIRFLVLGRLKVIRDFWNILMIH